LPDQEHRATFVEPLQTVKLLDLRLADRSAGGEVDVFERRPERELGGLDAVSGFAFLPVVRFGLQ
jgi:hypothetical protein